MNVLPALGISLALTLGGLPCPAHAESAISRDGATSYRVSADDVAGITDLSHSTISRQTRQRADITLAQKAALVAPCVALSYGDVYCLGLGFRDNFPRYERLLRAPAGRATGGLPFRKWVKQRWALSNDARVAAQVEEVGDVEASLDKALAVQAFLDALETDHPLTTMDSLAAQDAETSEVATPRLTPPDGDFRYIMAGYATKQNNSNWCGPATFQMLDWADDDTKQTQTYWAGELGTTSSGTAITSMVSLTNSRTAWDNAAGTYIVQGVGTWDKDQFFNVHKSHIGDSTPAPIIEHPMLWTDFFNYLTFNGNGHFQVGRGFSDPADPDLDRTIGIFDPWNEADWYATGTTTWGPHNVQNLALLQATKANSNFKNIGL